MLRGARPVVDVAYGGGEADEETPYARSAGYRITIYEKAFAERGARSPRLTPVLFHELIHVARGTELDAEAFENAWFTREEGARPPNRADWGIFRDQGFQGWWVRLDPRTRRVTDYADRFIVTFPRMNAREGNKEERHGKGEGSQEREVGGENHGRTHRSYATDGS
jgi:hypothetical protein